MTPDFWLGLRGDAYDAVTGWRTRMISKAEAHYRKAVTEAKRCGTCVMFRPASSTCTLVRGPIRASDLCDEWQKKPG